MKKYLYLLKPNLKSLIFLGFSIILYRAVYLISFFVDAVLIDTIAVTSSVNDLINITLIYAFFVFAVIVLRHINNITQQKLSIKIAYTFKETVINHLQKIDLLKYKKFDPIYLSKRTDDDTLQFATFFVENYVQMFITGIEIIVVLIILFGINIYMGIYSVIVLPFFIFVSILFKKPLRQRNLEYVEQSAIFFKDYAYQFQNMEQILIDSNLENEKIFFKSSFSVFYNKFKRNINIKHGFLNLSALLGDAIGIVIFFIGGLGVINGLNTIGETVVSGFFFHNVIVNIKYYMNLNQSIQTTKASLIRLDEIFDIPKLEAGNLKIQEIFKIDVHIKNFNIEDRSILRDFKFSAKKGEIIGILGKNGTGKSTFSKMLIGLIKPENEDDIQIKFNEDHNIFDLDTVHTRNSNISYVPQVISFKDIKLSELFAEFEKPSCFLDKLKKVAFLNDEIENIVNENWDKNLNDLSGGNKQAIFILKNILENKNVLIFDEPTSNLDVSKIVWFKELIRCYKKNKIIFIITHEESILDTLDKSIFF